jgi:hypothetical protein
VVAAIGTGDASTPSPVLTATALLVVCADARQVSPLASASKNEVRTELCDAKGELGRLHVAATLMRERDFDAPLH